MNESAAESSDFDILAVVEARIQAAERDGATEVNSASNGSQDVARLAQNVEKLSLSKQQPPSADVNCVNGEATKPGAVPVSPQSTGMVETHGTRGNADEGQRQLKQLLNLTLDQDASTGAGSQRSTEASPLPTTELSTQNTIQGPLAEAGAYAVGQSQTQPPLRNNSTGSGNGSSRTTSNFGEISSAAMSLQAELAPDIDEIVAKALQNREREITQGLVTADVLMPLLPQKSDSQLPVFPKDEEKRFQVEHAAFNKHMLRLMLPLGASTLLFFILWDYFQDGSILVPLALRIAFSVYAVGVFAFTYTRHFTRYAQAAAMSGFVAVSTVLSIILWHFRNGFVVGIAGQCLCVMVASTGTMQQRAATIYYLYTLLLTNLLLGYSENNPSFSLGFVYFNTNFFLIPFCSWGFIINYLVELHLRQRFRDTGTIFQWVNSSSNHQGMSESAPK